jgi:CelD/BcsL family acetyltransferase involved in cellulose biosynthesis
MTVAPHVRPSDSVPPLDATAIEAAPVSFSVLRGPKGLEAAAEVWEQIAAALPDYRYGQAYAWIASYVEALDPHPEEFLVVIASQRSRPVAILPLSQSRTRMFGIPLHVLSIANHAHVTLSDIVCAPSLAPAVMRAFIAQLHSLPDVRCDLLVFPQILATSAIAAGLSALDSSRVLIRRNGASNVIPCGTTYDEMLARFSKNFRGNLRKARNKLNTAGNVEFAFLRQPEELGDGFERFLRVEASGWKGQEGTNSAISLHQDLLRFYRSIVRRLAGRGCEINLLSVDGRDIAGQFCVSFGRTYSVLKIGYDESVAQFAPGNMMFEALLRRLLPRDDLLRVDLVSDTPWHVSWCPETTSCIDGYVSAPGARGGAALALLRARYALTGPRT